MTEFDVVGVGNAIVDVIAMVDDDFIDRHGLSKGSMSLIDSERAHQLYDAMPSGIEASGGSAANTMAGIASFGGRAAYIGKVRDDQLGEVFRHDIRATGVSYEVPAAAEGPPTARCLIQVTPDAQRTLNTFLGVSSLLAPIDVDENLVASAKVVYCEGYLWDIEIAKQAIRKAMDAGRATGATTALTLSDSFCVDRHRDEWLDLLQSRVDIVFANEDEICALYQCDWDKAATRIAEHVSIACLTRSAAGSVIVTPTERLVVAAHPCDHLVDTTGAGDLYASGFLYGYTQGLDLATCGRLASLAAAEIIGHMGARPAVPLHTLLQSVGEHRTR
jgi:sugar/nucleoside kinase (ribokinase family)